ncbi:MAG TPA: hypothetical protein VHT05_00095 [Candidatus Elarobacter sp.]|jgi:hypothetical protein|nr:hypothetical protein [Candidatus Elarobacter sp.]
MTSPGPLRELFRRLRDPRTEREALAALIGGPAEDDLRAVVTAFIETTLRDYDPRYREIVVRADIEGKPGKQVAAELALAPRTYYRLRAVAMDALERALDQRLRRNAPAAAATSGDPHAALMEIVAAIDPARAHAIVAQLGGSDAEQRFTSLRLRVLAGEMPADVDFARLDDAHRFAGDVVRARGYESGGLYEAAEALVTSLEADPATRRPEHRADAFDLAVIRRLQARRRGRAGEHTAAVADMVALAAGNPALEASAAIAYAHVAIHAPVGDWRERLESAKRALRDTTQVGTLRYATMVEGYLAYVHGDPELALNRARISTLEGTHPSVALQGEALHARATLALGRTWRRPDWTRDVLPHAWFQAELEALGACHALAHADENEARRLVTDALAHPSAPHAPPVVALAGAVQAVLRGERPGHDPRVDDVLTDVDVRTLDAVTERGRPPQQPPPSSNGSVRSISS